MIIWIPLFAACTGDCPPFCLQPKDRRDLLLNQRKPEFDTSLNGAISAAADDFVRITLKAQAAKDYFFLVGPPGTGKTSSRSAQHGRGFL